MIKIGGNPLTPIFGFMGLWVYGFNSSFKELLYDIKYNLCIIFNV
jgi:hypothetical protein